MVRVAVPEMALVVMSAFVASVRADAASTAVLPRRDAVWLVPDEIPRVASLKPKPPPPPKWTAPGSMAAPFFSDPLFDASHDAEFVWHAGEQTWWLTYLQNRYNSPFSDPDDCGGCFYIYTDLGLASTPDAGKTWIYRGVMQGLGAPQAWLRPDGKPLWAGMRQNGSAHGGATWWRPAVVYNPDDSLYHGFFAYLLQNRAAEGSFHVTHYTSMNLTDWNFRAFIPHLGDFSRYDSVVFRIKDGRFILVSAGNGPPNLQSQDLQSWQPVSRNDSGLLCGFSDPVLNARKECTDEGPHVTRWNGKMWFNMEPRCDDTNGTRSSCQQDSVLRSDDGGLTFKPQPFNIFANNSDSPRYMDTGQAHQGPLLGQGSRMLVQYFTEARYALGADMKAINNQRSVLQVAPVEQGRDGWLRANRSAEVPLPLLPPDGANMIDRGPVARQTQPTVWHIKASDAMIIAAAEMNRWVPRWCPDEDHSHELLQGYALRAAPYCSMHTANSSACVAACRGDPGCAAAVVRTGAACSRPGPPALHGLQLNTQVRCVSCT